MIMEPVKSSRSGSSVRSTSYFCGFATWTSLRRSLGGVSAERARADRRTPDAIKGASRECRIAEVFFHGIEATGISVHQPVLRCYFRGIVKVANHVLIPFWRAG